jgi:hypothetical protein
MKILREAVCVSFRSSIPGPHGMFSGVETISHIRENGRITIMFSAFDGAPRIVRLFGKGSCHAN